MSGEEEAPQPEEEPQDPHGLQPGAAAPPGAQLQTQPLPVGVRETEHLRAAAAL